MSSCALYDFVLFYLAINIEIAVITPDLLWISGRHDAVINTSSLIRGRISRRMRKSTCGVRVQNVSESRLVDVVNDVSRPRGRPAWPP